MKKKGRNLASEIYYVVPLIPALDLLVSSFWNKAYVTSDDKQPATFLWELTQLSLTLSSLLMLATTSHHISLFGPLLCCRKAEKEIYSW